MNTAISPKVSVIIPVYNARKHLKRCIASVCAQTLQDIEIICINDGSTDDSLNILRDFANRDSRIILIDQKNEGVANARNKGLQKATAPYIGFVDSDDFIAPDMYEKMYNAMTMNDVDFVECGAEPMFTYKLFDEQWTRHYLSTGNLTGKVDGPDVFINTSDGLWKILFVKDIILNYKLNFTEGVSICEDNLFIVSYKSLVKAGFYIPDNLYIYFYYENSAMGKAFAKKQGQRVVEVLKVIELYYSFLKTHGIFERWKNYFWTYFERWINSFYQWAAPEIIRTTGIETIRDLIRNEDISKLIDEKNKEYHNFLTLEENQLMDLTFLIKKEPENQQNSNEPVSNEPVSNEIIKKRITLRKIIKWLSPYFVVRLIQRNRKDK